MATVLGQQLLYLGLVALLLAAPAWAQFGVPWQRTPMIAAISTDDKDPRHALVDEAIDFWNRTLQEINSGFRLGPPVRHVMPIPEEGLRTLSTSIVGRGGASVQVPSSRVASPATSPSCSPTRTSCRSPDRSIRTAGASSASRERVSSH